MLGVKTLPPTKVLTQIPSYDSALRGLTCLSGLSSGPEGSGIGLTNCVRVYRHEGGRDGEYCPTKADHINRKGFLVSPNEPFCAGVLHITL